MITVWTDRTVCLSQHTPPGLKAERRLIGKGRGPTGGGGDKEGGRVLGRRRSKNSKGYRCHSTGEFLPGVWKALSSVPWTAKK